MAKKQIETPSAVMIREWDDWTKEEQDEYYARQKEDIRIDKDVAAAQKILKEIHDEVRRNQDAE